jgi:hypothetical protein
MFVIVILSLLVGPHLAAQEETQERDSIPEALRQPQRGEAPRYPQDMVIGSLAQGEVPDEARRFAAEVLSALLAGNREAQPFSGIGSLVREEMFAALGEVEPRRYRIGEGREEADGSYSFLVRFLGRERGVAGELYLRFDPVQAKEVVEPVADADEPAADSTPGEGIWRFDDLLLEEPRDLGDVEQGPTFNLPPYERLF